jgi:hypothetical protein
VKYKGAAKERPGTLRRQHREQNSSLNGAVQQAIFRVSTVRSVCAERRWAASCSFCIRARVRRRSAKERPGTLRRQHREQNSSLNGAVQQARERVEEDTPFVLHTFKRGDIQGINGTQRLRRAPLGGVMLLLHSDGAAQLRRQLC